MIIRKTDEGMTLIRQTDHALLSGQFAAAWAWPYPHRPSVVTAACRHDDGWAGWELAPKLADSGRPHDFITTPVEDHVALYRHGIDLVEVEDAYAGLLVSMHGQRLYTRPFVADNPPRIDTLQDRDHELATEHVEYETQRQATLAETAIRVLGGPLITGDLVADAEEAWRLLQVWDRLSLLCCMHQLGPDSSMDIPPVRGPDGDDVQFRAIGTPDGALQLDPYPFQAEASFHVHALELESTSWPDESAFRQAYRLGRNRIIEIRTVPAG